MDGKWTRCQTDLYQYQAHAIFTFIMNHLQPPTTRPKCDPTSSYDDALGPLWSDQMKGFSWENKSLGSKTWQYGVLVWLCGGDIKVWSMCNNNSCREFILLQDSSGFMTGLVWWIHWMSNFSITPASSSLWPSLPPAEVQKDKAKVALSRCCMDFG